MKTVASLAVVTVMLFASHAKADPPASLQGIGFLDGSPPSSSANGISGDGTVVMCGSRSSTAIIEACKWENGVLSSLNIAIPSNAFSLARASSFDGSSIIGNILGAQISVHGFLLDDGVSVDIGIMSPSAISDDGTVIAGSISTGSAIEAVRWTVQTGAGGLGDFPGGEFISLASGINADGSMIVGKGRPVVGQQAWYWTEATGMVGLDDLPGGSFVTWATDVSSDGMTIVGSSYSGISRDRAVRWPMFGGIIDLRNPPGGGSSFNDSAVAVSGDGSVIVGSSLIGPFIWDQDNGLRQLESALTESGVDISGWSLDFSSDVSHDGFTVVGVGRNNSGYREGFIAVIPRCSLPGDFTADGVLGVDDIPGFVAALLDPDVSTGIDWCRGDVNQDNSLDSRDIAPFVAAVVP